MKRPLFGVKATPKNLGLFQKIDERERLVEKLPKKSGAIF